MSFPADAETVRERRQVTYERSYALTGLTSSSSMTYLDTPAEVGRAIEEALVSGRRSVTVYVRDREVKE